jgi:hypothetical protein
VIEFDQPGYLNTPIGDLLINQYVTDVGYFMVDVSKATPQPFRPIRATSDPIPQGDGAILHRRFTNGTELTIPIQMWKTIGDPGEPACGEDLRVMLEYLALYVQSILNGRGRWFWTPSGYGDDRMLDECRWLVPFSRDLSSGKLTTITFGIDSPFPYFIDSNEQFGSDTTIADGDTGILTNDGNMETYPVIEVLGGLGGVTDFTITNNSLVDQNGDPLQIVYTGNPAIPAGEYAEITVFDNKIYLNGNQQNIKSGIDAELTDFFYLRPGDNEIEPVGADVAFKFNNAWVPV